MARSVDAVEGRYRSLATALIVWFPAAAARLCETVSRAEEVPHGDGELGAAVMLAELAEDPALGQAQPLVALLAGYIAGVLEYRDVESVMAQLRLGPWWLAQRVAAGSPAGPLGVALAAAGEHVFADMGTCVCGLAPADAVAWELHRMRAALLAVADWFATRASATLAGDPHVLAADWAAGLLRQCVDGEG